MAPIDYFAWFVLILLLVSSVVIWIVLAMLPGKIARQRNHPNSDAINVAGWLGALAAGVFWPIALIWAYTNHSRSGQISSKDTSDEGDYANSQVLEIEAAPISKEESRA